MAEIEIRDLTKDYGLNRGVFNVSLSIEKGECYGFLGPNGAGKSTTIRHLMGFSKPDSGSCKIKELESFENTSKILNCVGYLPGEVALPEGLTGTQFIKMMHDMRHLDSNNREKELLDLFELDPSGNTKSMSLGQKRKLAIVVAFMHDPDVLILDEPTSGLDPIMQQRFIKFIKDEKKKGKTILLSSHMFSEVDATCDKIAIIKDGKIVDKFITNDLKHTNTKIYEVYFNSSKEYKGFISDTDNINEVSILEKLENENKCTIRFQDEDINVITKLLAKYKIKKLIQDKETLQDYFMKFYKENHTYEEV